MALLWHVHASSLKHDRMIADGCYATMQAVYITDPWLAKEIFSRQADFERTLVLFDCFDRVSQRIEDVCLILQVANLLFLTNLLFIYIPN